MKGEVHTSLSRRDLVKLGTAAGAGAMAATALAPLARAERVAAAAAATAPAINNTKEPFNFLPAVSYDKKSLAFVAGESERHSIYHGPVYATGGKPELVVPATNDHACVIHALCYSHYGDKLAFLRQTVDKEQLSGRLSLEEVDLTTGKVSELLRLVEVKDGITSGELFAPRFTNLTYDLWDTAILFVSPTKGLISYDIEKGSSTTLVAGRNSLLGVQGSTYGTVEYLRRSSAEAATFWEHVEYDTAQPTTNAVVGTVKLAKAYCIPYQQLAFHDSAYLAFTAESAEGGSQQVVHYDLTTGSEVTVAARVDKQYRRPGAFVDRDLVIMEESTITNAGTLPQVKLTAWEV